MINIVNRILTTNEVERVSKGFDELSNDEGIALESTENISFVALQQDDFVGCASGLAHMNGDSYSGWFQLTDLFVEKGFRNQGLGGSLLKRLEDALKTKGIVHIWLWTSEPPTIRFYERHGYTQFCRNGKLVFQWQ
jgi:GNAT superfamily N-acetyltransferase